MFHNMKSSSSSPSAPLAPPVAPAATSPHPMKIMMSRQSEMHRILLEEHQKLQKSHHLLCEKLMSETKRLMTANNISNGSSSITGFNKNGTFTRSPAKLSSCSSSPLSSSATMTRIPRSVSLKKISSSKSVMDLRLLNEPAVRSSHHRSQVNLAHNDHESDDQDDFGEDVSGTRESHAAEDHVNELKQQLVRVLDQLQESKDQNELLEFRIFELEKVNEELMEQTSGSTSTPSSCMPASSPSCSSCSGRKLSDVICSGQCLNQDCLSVRERLESKEKDLIEENMKLQMEVVALKDEVSLLMESSRDTASAHTELRRTASHQMSSSEDEGLADLEVRMRRDSVNDRDSPAEEGVEESSEDSSSASSYCPILINNNTISISSGSNSSAGSIAGSESGISGSLFLDNGTQTELFFPLHELGLEKSTPILSPSSPVSISPAPHSASPVTEHPASSLLHQATSPIPSLDDIDSQTGLSATESECQTDDTDNDLRCENAMLKDANHQLLKQKESLSEQVLELEEAENDARSLSQKLQTQVTSLVNQIESLQAMLMHERDSLQKKEALIKQYEEKVKEFLSTQSKQKPLTTGGSSEETGRTTAASRSSSSAGSTTGSNESIDSVSDYALMADHSTRKGSSSVGGGGVVRAAGGSIWNKIHRFEKKIRIRIKSNLTVNGKKDHPSNPNSVPGTPAHVSSIAIRPMSRHSEPEEGLLDRDYDECEDEFVQDERRRGDRGSPKAAVVVAGSVEASGVDEEEEEEGEEVDDLQVFISEKEMMKQNIGSSFEASAFHHHPSSKHYLPLCPPRKNRHHLLLPSSPASDVHYDFESQREANPQSETTGVAASPASSSAFHAAHGHDASSLQSTSSSLPLCETIKPLRIDINNRHQTNIHVQQQHPPPPSTTTVVRNESTSSCNGRNVIINISNKKKPADQEPQPAAAACTTLPDSHDHKKQPPLMSGKPFTQVSHLLVKLEQNERLLRDKLIKLEWINKEFVHELELRERILNSKEADHKELQLIKSTFSHEVQRIQSALDLVNQKLAHNHEQELNSSNEHRLKSLESSELTQMQEQERQLISEMSQKESEFNLIKKSFEEKRKKLDADHEAVAVNLMVRMKDMESESALTVRQLEEQRKTIYQELEACVREFNLNEIVMTKKISGLEQDLEQVKAELRESREREAAFKETINRADQIISDAEEGYKERIDSLRESEAQLTKRIHQLEEELEDMNSSSSSATCYSSSSNDHASLEISLRECITRLEESEHSMKNKIKCLENERNELLIELQENEQVINKNTHLQREYESLKKDFSFLKSYKSDLEDLLKNQAEVFAKKETELLAQIAALKKQKDNLETSMCRLRIDMEQETNKTELFDDDEIIENSRL